MSNIIILLASLLSLNSAISAEHYYSHITIDAQTLDPGHFALENSPGASITTSALLGSISVGVYKNIQIGTIPMLYISDIHKYNFNFKYTAYQSKNLKISLGYSHLRFKVDSKFRTIGQTNFTLHYISPSINYFIQDSPYCLGLTFSKAINDVDGFEKQTNARSGSEWAFDISRKIKSNFILSGGIGEHQTEVISFRGFDSFGAGISGTWLRPGKLFSSPKLGFQYLFNQSKALLLFNTSFY